MNKTLTSTLGTRIFPRLYRDSVTLMALASAIEQQDGVVRVGAVMATPANRQILAASDMWPANLTAAPDDLVIAVRAVDNETLDTALDAAEAGLTAVDSGPGENRETAPQTVAEGLAAAESAGLGRPTILTVSAPGEYAAAAVEQGLKAGLHVFCFSDNVPVADEVRLKDLARDRSLLLMGPDCGTAVIDGVPLGFANVVRRGPVGIVAASGTGAQEISVLLDHAGTGISQLIGVGGRDLSTEVHGRMTEFALDLLAGDPDTEVIVVVSKPPAPEVAEQLLARLAGLGRPAVACLLGHVDANLGGVIVRGTLEGGAAAAAELTGHTLQIEPTTLPSAPAASGVLGLYTGGTLAGEAETLLGDAGVTAEILDLGDDQYTAGRPHPMIDPAARSAAVIAAGDRADIGILLVDLVLGYGAAADPAAPLAQAVRQARAGAAAQDRDLVVLGSVTGTVADPQGLGAQRRTLEDAGVFVHPSNAAAVRTAIALATADRPTDPEESA